MITMAPKTPVWKLELHTAAKHSILQHYLNAWIPKISRYYDQVIFFDGFAGPGVYEGGEDGSPVLALKARLDHSHGPQIQTRMIFIFIEENPERFELLQQRLSDFDNRLPGNVRYRVKNDSYESALVRLLDWLDAQNKPLDPTLLFIDPFGISGIPLELIQRVLQHRGCEVLINIMVGSLSRFVQQPEFETHCDALFGCRDWRDLKALSTETERVEAFRKLYESRLRDVVSGAGARYVRMFSMLNEHNRPIYDLFFATNHPAGIDAMKEAMWKVDPSGFCTFSDITNPDQAVLFTAEPAWNRLWDLLHEQFAGQTRAWAEVEEAIRHTPFRAMKKVIKSAAKDGRAGFSIEYPPGGRRALNKNCRLRFDP